MAAVSATSAYRQLLRATRIAFWGDWHTLFAARAEARRHFDANLQQSVDAPMKIQEAVDAAQLLRTNVVQGRRIESEDGDKYELRIHDEIERGDNDTIKMPNKGGNVRVDKCCGSS